MGIRLIHEALAGTVAMFDVGQMHMNSSKPLVCSGQKKALSLHIREQGMRPHELAGKKEDSELELTVMQGCSYIGSKMSPYQASQT